MPMAPTRITGVNGTTMLLQHDDVGSGAVIVSNCTDAFLYVLAPTSFVHIDGCTTCTLVLGPVCNLIAIDGCEKVNVMAVCSRIRITSCASSTFYLACREVPTLAGEGIDSVFFAPYNTFYETLEADMAQVGLDDLRRSHVFSDRDGHGAESEGAPRSLAKLLPPDAFDEFVVPFCGANDGRRGVVGAHPLTLANPFPLPDEYSLPLKEKLESLMQLRSAIYDASLDDASNLDVQRTIHAHFRSWLQRTGRMKQVEDLIAISSATNASHRSLVSS